MEYLKIEDADSMNVPVNVHIFATANSNGEACYSVEASNLQTRKNHIIADIFRSEYGSREEAQAAITRYILPLYAAAMANLLTGHCGIWEVTNNIY